jgi:hypothetical protein
MTELLCSLFFVMVQTTLAAAICAMAIRSVWRRI